MLVTPRVVLAIAPHIDDVELGAGGAIHRWAKTCEVHYVGLSLPPAVTREVFLAEFAGSLEALGVDRSRVILRDHDPRDLFRTRLDILQLFYDLNKQLSPDVVLVPSSYDIHQSHEVVCAEARRVFKNTTLLGYEMPWNNLAFSMSAFVTLDESDLNAKVAAIDCYETQKHRTFFSNDIVADLARVRGKQIGREYAECFELMRLIL